MAAPGMSMIRARSYGNLAAAQHWKLHNHEHEGPGSTPLLLSPSALRDFARAKARRLITGDDSRSLRQTIWDELEKPIRVQLKDKICFTLGVVNMCMTVALVVRFPSLFKWWYSVWAGPLLLWRYVSYSRQKYQYFMLDYCYFVNLLCLVHLFVFPDDPIVFELAFMSASGPLAFAVVAWRNSLVFHDVDKITSLFIHIMPPMLMFTRRWSYIAESPGTLDELPQYLRCDEKGSPLFYPYHSELVARYSTCSKSYWRVMVLPLIFYVSWQIVYFFKTEVIDHARLKADPELQTSLRWLAKSGKGGLHAVGLWLARGLRIVGRSEHFDPDAAKTKLVFMGMQFVYTMLTLLPTKLMYDYYWPNLIYLALLGTAAAWNGSAYYIEVFSRRYMSGIEKAIAEYAKKQESRVRNVAVEAADAAAVHAATVFNAARIQPGVGALPPIVTGRQTSGDSTVWGSEIDVTPRSAVSASTAGSTPSMTVQAHTSQLGGFDFGALADGVYVPSPVAEASRAVHAARARRRRVNTAHGSMAS